MVGGITAYAAGMKAEAAPAMPTADIDRRRA